MCDVGQRTSRAVPLVIVPAMAAVAVAMGCGSGTPPSQRVCVDNARTVVDQQRCIEEEQRGRGASGSFASGGTGNPGGGGGGGYIPMHHWYYFRGGVVPLPGTPAPINGSFTAPVSSGSTSSSSSSGVVRGGFGSTASGAVGE